MKRYKELKFEDKTYTEQYKIDEILIKNKFDWFLECEVENVKLEILKNTLVFNSGVFFNGDWKYGVFRDGQWKYGTWEGGVWYNGTWYNGTFQNGLIFNGRFINGEIVGGEIRGGEFFDVVISDNVVKNIENPNKNSLKPQQGVQKNIQSHPQIQPQILGENRILRFNEGVFNNIKKFFNQNRIDDELGNQIIKKLQSSDFTVSCNSDNDLYIVILKKKYTDNDPFGEEENNDDLILKIDERYMYVENPSIYLNDILMDFNSNITWKIINLVKNKYKENINKDRSNKIKKFRDILD